MEFLILFLLSFIPRLLFLFFSMPSITHDEADIFINGYLLSKTGSDVWGNKLFMTSGLLSANSPLAIYYLTFIFLLLPKTIFTARLALLFLNSLIPVLIYFITNIFTKNKHISIFAFLSSNFSPWLIYLSSQSGFNAPVSLMFYLLSIYITLSVKKPLLRYALFFLFLFLSFNSYLGFASVFSIFVAIGLIIDQVFNQERLNLKKMVSIFLISIAVHILFMFFVIKSPGNIIFKSTQNKILNLNKDQFTNQIWYENLTSSGNKIADKIINNKILVIVNILISRYINAFNPEILFVKGDSHPIYGTNRFGFFYLWEMFFLLIGIINFFEVIKNKSLHLFYILIAILIFSPISLILQKDVTLAFRSITMVFPISVFVGIGIYFCLKKLKINKVFVFILYFLSFLYFFILFNFKIKITSSEQWHLGEKKLFEKVLKGEKNKKIYIVNNEPKETFMLFAFYHIDDAPLIKKKLQTKDYTYENIIFTDKKLSLLKDGVVLVKRGVQDVDKKIKEKIIPEKPYLEASDKSGVLYYLIQ